MRNLKTLIFLLVIFLAGVCMKINAQIEGPERDAKVSTGSIEASSAREDRIKKELEGLKDHPWAGEYYYGDGLGVNVRLTIAPKSGFAFTWSGCMGLYDLNYGEINESNGRIKLLFEHPNKREGFQGIASELIPVLWGERHYLIPSDKMVEFTNAVNAGFEPCTMFCSSFLLKEGDKKKKVSGGPNIPDEFLSYLIKKPIKVGIVSVGESTIKKHTDIPTMLWRTTRVRFDAGSLKGIKVGMGFHVTSPERISESATVTKVEENFSEAEIIQLGEEVPIPAVNWKFSTRLF